MPLQTGTWPGVWNGKDMQLSIDNVDNQGVVRGTVGGLAPASTITATGFWDEDSQKLVLAIPMGGSSTREMVTLKGYLFQDSNRLTGAGNVIYTLVGYSNAMPTAGLGTTATKSKVGWYAQIGVG